MWVMQCVMRIIAPPLALYPYPSPLLSSPFAGKLDIVVTIFVRVCVCVHPCIRPGLSVP